MQNLSKFFNKSKKNILKKQVNNNSNMAQIKANQATNQPNCVRVSRIIKNVGRDNVVRHIDFLLT